MPGRQRLLEALKTQYPLVDEKTLHARILCGEVLVDGEKVLDPAALVRAGVGLAFRPGPRFVSRGGEKLDAVLSLWEVAVAGKVFIDAGSSRGGFTDCLLQRGASRVFAVDVGYNQLDYRMRRHPRVTVLERMNVMDLRPGVLVPPPEAAVADLSFRSLERAAAHLLGLAGEGWAIALVKPQFEWARPDRGFRGVVERREDYRRILADLLERLWAEGSYVQRVARSPLAGRKGNIEFFFLLGGQEHRTMGQVARELEPLLPE